MIISSNTNLNKTSFEGRVGMSMKNFIKMGESYTFCQILEGKHQVSQYADRKLAFEAEQILRSLKSWMSGMHKKSVLKMDKHGVIHVKNSKTGTEVKFDVPNIRDCYKTISTLEPDKNSGNSILEEQIQPAIGKLILSNSAESVDEKLYTILYNKTEELRKSKNPLKKISLMINEYRLKSCAREFGQNRVS